MIDFTKIYKNKAYWAVLVIVFLIVMAGFVFANKQATAPVQQIVNTPTTKTDAQATPNPSPLDDFGDLSSYDTITPDEWAKLYPGSFVLTGSYYIAPGDMIGPNLCFTADEQTAKLIHRDKDDSREGWFCFQNNKQAQLMLGVDKAGELGTDACFAVKGEATITAKNHYYNRAEGEAFDLATLVLVNKVITKARCIPVSE